MSATDAELDQAIVGGLFLTFNEGFVLLANVAVDPAFAGLCLGRGFIKRAEDGCRKQGLPPSHFDLTGLAFHSAEVAQLGIEGWESLQSKIIMDYMAKPETVETPPASRLAALG